MSWQKSDQQHHV